MATLRMAENFEQCYTYEAINWYTLKKKMSLLINRGNFENSIFCINLESVCTYNKIIFNVSKNASINQERFDLSKKKVSKLDKN